MHEHNILEKREQIREGAVGAKCVWKEKKNIPSFFFFERRLKLAAIIKNKINKRKIKVSDFWDPHQFAIKQPFEW